MDVLKIMLLCVAVLVSIAGIRTVIGALSLNRRIR